MSAFQELIYWMKYRYPIVLLIGTVVGLVVAAVLITRSITIAIVRRRKLNDALEIQKRDAVIFEQRAWMVDMKEENRSLRSVARGVMSAVSGIVQIANVAPRKMPRLRRVSNDAK